MIAIFLLYFFCCVYRLCRKCWVHISYINFLKSVTSYFLKSAFLILYENRNSYNYFLYTVKRNVVPYLIGEVYRVVSIVPETFWVCSSKLYGFSLSSVAFTLLVGSLLLELIIFWISQNPSCGGSARIPCRCPCGLSTLK